MPLWTRRDRNETTNAARAQNCFAALRLMLSPSPSPAPAQPTRDMTDAAMADFLSSISGCDLKSCDLGTQHVFAAAEKPCVSLRRLFPV